MFGRRADATPVRNLSMLRRFMPFVSPRRNESLVYFETEIEVEPALRFLEEQNQRRPPERKMTLFHLYLRSIAISLHTRPGLNRFTAGGRLWQRDGVWITFSAKQAIVDGAKMMTVKRRFEENESLDETVDAVLDSLRGRRRGVETRADKEMNLALYMPPFVIRIGVLLLRAADSLGLLPKKMIDDDPLFTSVFVANLGSLGMEAGYHHVWEYGTCPMFAMMGRIKERHDGVRVMSCRYTYDERIEDGLYAGISLAAVKEGLENPTKLL
ncbi:MAG: hypothetical protein O7A09_12900 [Proteobacteria bacterium]|nr:hypothetical protein [Pseudomonadota bacterium]